jgi:type I restriction enzyme, S subunit
VPEQWEIKRIKHLALLKSGESITSLDINEKGDYPVFGGNGLRGFTSNYTHNGDFVLIGRQGALCGNVNYASGYFWASEHAVVVNPIQIYNLLWFGELLRTMNLNQYSISAAQPGLSVERIQNISIPVPSLEEQQMISNFIASSTANLDNAISFSKNEINLLREYRTRLIADVVTGKLDVREAAANLPDEVEEPDVLEDEVGEGEGLDDEHTTGFEEEDGA